MNFVSAFMAVFSLLGAVDYVLGSRFGLGKEFEKGFMFFGPLALSMVGMIVIAPLLGEVMQPVSQWLYNTLSIDPSILPAMVFANDMGGAPLAAAMAKDDTMGLFNGLVVSSMMGCTISFTIPCALGIVKKEQQEPVLLGFLCGIVTIPLGCIAVGLMLGIKPLMLLWNMLPMLLLSALISWGLMCAPQLCVKIFKILGLCIRVLIVFGLAMGIVRFLTGIELIKGLASLEEGASICVSACVFLSGAFPFLSILSRLLRRLLRELGKRIGINEASAMGAIFTVAASLTTFQSIERMDEKGAVLNSAFAISAAFLLGDHLAFTLSYHESFWGYVVLGKLIAGVSAVLLSGFVYRLTKKSKENKDTDSCAVLAKD